MTGHEAKALREQTGCSVTAWADLLGIKAQTVRNIESGKNPKLAPGKALEQLWRLSAEKYKKRKTTP